ncbi:hypothetical protein D3C78_755260 [compost metagenome]
MGILRELLIVKGIHAPHPVFSKITITDAKIHDITIVITANACLRKEEVLVLVIDRK